MSAFCLCNMSLISDKELVVYMMDNGLVQIIEKCFDFKNNKNLLSCLEALENLLKIYSEKINPDDKGFFAIVDNYNILAKVEGLQYHGNDQVFNKVFFCLNY